VDFVVPLEPGDLSCVDPHINVEEGKLPTPDEEFE